MCSRQEWITCNSRILIKELKFQQEERNVIKVKLRLFSLAFRLLLWFITKIIATSFSCHENCLIQ
jgi:hypothetical protein